RESLLGLVCAGLRERLRGRCPSPRISSSLAPSRSGSSHRQLDAVSGDFSLGVLLWDKVKVFLGNLQPAMGSDNIRVFNIFLIQVAELPVRLLGTLRVLEVGDLAENSDLLDQALKSANVNGEGRAVSSCFKALQLIPVKLFSPDSD